jgi:hypothetical protein
MTICDALSDFILNLIRNLIRDDSTPRLKVARIK